MRIQSYLGNAAARVATSLFLVLLVFFLTPTPTTAQFGWLKDAAGGIWEGVKTVGDLPGKAVGSFIGTATKPTIRNVENSGHQIVKDLDRRMEARIVQLSDEIDESLGNNIDKVDQSLEDRIDQIDQSMEKRIYQIDGVISKSLLEVDRISEARVQQLDKVATVRIKQVDQVLVNRINQIDKSIGRTD